MINEKDIIKCESIFSDDHAHRFMWRRVWNKDKPLAGIIMLNPAHADNIMVDTSSALVVNNIARLGSYGGIVVVNLYSLITKKLDFRWNSDEELNDPQNDAYIRKFAEECSIIILGYGKAYESNYRITERADKVLELFKPFENKLFEISDGERKGLHPLTPALRNGWVLTPYVKENHTKNAPKPSANNIDPVV